MTNVLTLEYEEAAGHPLRTIPTVLPQGAIASKNGDLVSIILPSPLDPIPIAPDGTFYGYEFEDKKLGETKVIALSDFVMEPIATIKVNGDEAQTIFLVRVFAYGHAVEGEEHQISATLFSNPGAFQKWCNMRRFQWNGNRLWLPLLFNRLNMSFVPELKGVTTTGLHDNAFVLEDKVLGQDAEQYAYVEPKMYDPTRKIEIAEYPTLADFSHEGAMPVITLLDGEALLPEWQREVEALGKLHNADIMTPILGWMAAAPLRSMFSKFPILGLFGGSGWGKTTIIETVLGSFGFHHESIGMKDATRYGVLAAVSGTNAFPVWIDEYRGTIRGEARACVDQVVRDAYDGSASPRGGMNADDLSAVTSVRISAPVIVSGEDRFTATSHVERTVLIDIGQSGRNTEALRIVDAGGGRLPMFFSLYLQWLLYLKVNDLLPDLPRCYNRQEHGRAVAKWGYGLLRSFCSLVGFGDVLPSWDISLVEQGQNEHVDIFEELLDDAAGVTDSDDRYVVLDLEGFRYVRVGAFVEWIRKNRQDADLPGGQKAISKYLQEKYQAVEFDRRVAGYRRCLRWPLVESQGN